MSSPKLSEARPDAVEVPSESPWLFEEQPVETFKLKGVDTGIVAVSQQWTNAIDRLERLARLEHGDPPTVTIVGRTGTGKELIARALHHANTRYRHGRFVPVNCGALSPNLIQSELFGHEKGAFTGADKPHPGYFEQARDGTIFLDEITSLPFELQQNLLRVLEERRVTRLCGRAPIPLGNIQILCAAQLPLKELVQSRQMREDLSFRLDVISVSLPPLCERREEIPSLVAHFVKRCRNGSPNPRGLSRRALQLLVDYPWPGNVRELQNMVQRMMVFYPHQEIIGEKEVRELFASSAGKISVASFAQVRRDYLLRILALSAFDLERAAKMAQVTREELRQLLIQAGIDAEVLAGKPAGSARA